MENTMASSSVKDIYQVTWLIRRAFRLMGCCVDNYLQDLDISACQRAIIEFISPDKKLSVPQIAELYDVSRQHVQTIVNELSERDIVEFHENPKHKRSPLVGLSAYGSALYEEIRKRDVDVFSELFSDINQKNSQSTINTLQKLVDSLTLKIEHDHQREN